MTTPSLTATTPTTLRALIVVLLSLSLAWGALGAWTVTRHASAAGDVVNVDEPLRLDAQRMYASISDADVTASTTFLFGPEPPLASLQRYQTDVAAAALDLNRLKAAAGGDRRFTTALTTVAAGLPVYTGYEAQARSDYALGYQLTAGSVMQVASEEADLVLLPAANTIYERQDSALASASSQATGLTSTIPLLVLAIVIGLALYPAQRWLTRRFRRVFNYGLVTASAALIISVLWLAVTFAVARTDLVRGIDHGSLPAGMLAKANIDVQQARGDEVLNLISRSGDTPFEQNYDLLRGQIGPGPGTLLTAAASSSGVQAATQLGAAARDADSWYPANAEVYRLDAKAQYEAETKLVTGTGPDSSAGGFAKLESDIRGAIADDLSTFQSSATAGAHAFDPLEGMVIVVSVLMAAGCALGLSRRLGEYR